VADSTTYSTFILTLLLLVGLFFFIRASTKDRLEQWTACIPQAMDSTRAALQHHFEERAYHVTDLQSSADTAAGQRLELRGTVRASWFLAIFLSLLAGVGGGCLALVLGLLWPAVGYGWASVLLVAPLAGRFYWTRANRQETVIITLSPLPDQSDHTQVQVQGHRDELAVLRQSLGVTLAAG